MMAVGRTVETVVIRAIAVPIGKSPAFTAGVTANDRPPRGEEQGHLTGEQRLVVSPRVEGTTAQQMIRGVQQTCCR